MFPPVCWHIQKVISLSRELNFSEFSLSLFPGTADWWKFSLSLFPESFHFHSFQKVFTFTLYRTSWLVKVSFVSLTRTTVGASTSQSTFRFSDCLKYIFKISEYVKNNSKLNSNFEVKSVKTVNTAEEKLNWIFTAFDQVLWRLDDLAWWYVGMMIPWCDKIVEYDMVNSDMSTVQVFEMVRWLDDYWNLIMGVK